MNRSGTEEKATLRELKKKSTEAHGKVDLCKDNIYREWCAAWENGALPGEDHHFLELFQNSYEYVKTQAQMNKMKNFRHKGLFLFLVAAECACFLLFVWWRLKVSGELLYSGVFPVFLIGIVLASVFAKWTDIRKYQETWARHEEQLHKMEEQMFLYVSGVHPYANGNRNTVFRANILEVWRENHAKFVANLENKENRLNDVLDWLNALGGGKS